MRDPGSPLIVFYVGTTKLMALRARVRPVEGIEVESWTKREAKGFAEGLVRDSEWATEVMKELLEIVAENRDFYEVPLYGVVSNPEVRRYQVTSSLYFSVSKIIHEGDVDKLVRQTRSVAPIPLDEVILCTVPEEYRVNDLPEVRDPLGLEGRRLSVALHLFTMPVTAHRSLTRVFERLEVEPTLLIPKGLASGSLVLRDDERREGVILVEVGGCLSELYGFHEGSLCTSAVVPWGSERITEKILSRWDIPQHAARALKEEYGTLEPREVTQGDPISYVDASGRVRVKMPQAEFQDVIQREVESGLEILEREIQSLRKEHRPLHQLVLSGGTTEMAGFLEKAQEKMSLPSRIGYAAGLVGPQDLLSHPAHNGILGSLKFLSGINGTFRMQEQGSGFFSKAVGQVKNWIQDYF